jgi:adenylate kinase
MAARKALNAIILGAPGGGKGTISKKLVKKYNFAHVSTGDILRAHVQDPNSTLGAQAKEVMASGGLVPDKVRI